MIIDITFEVSYEVFVVVKFGACLIITGTEIVLVSPNKIVAVLLTVLHEILG
jgi:mannose-6-phosphate isomerase-like protein (cupin superfamily)